MAKTESYVVLDTNILFRIVSQAKGGNEWEELEAFKKTLEEDHAVLLIPEVIELEFEKKVRTMDSDRRLNLKRFIQSIEKSKVEWNEIEAVIQTACDSATKWETEQQTIWNERAKEINAWLQSDKHIRLPLSEKIQTSTKRRFIAGRFPKLESSDKRFEIENDCLIIDTLIEYFGGQIKHKQLLFCSDDTLFGTMYGETLRLDDLYSVGLPSSQVFKELKSLNEFLADHKKVHEPTLKEIEEAKEKVSVILPLQSEAEAASAREKLDSLLSLALFGKMPPESALYKAGAWLMPPELRAPREIPTEEMIEKFKEAAKLSAYYEQIENHLREQILSKKRN